MSGNISRMNKQQDNRVHWALNVLQNIVSLPRNDLDELALHKKKKKKISASLALNLHLKSPTLMIMRMCFYSYSWSRKVSQKDPIRGL